MILSHISAFRDNNDDGDDAGVASSGDDSYKGRHSDLEDIVRSCNTAAERLLDWGNTEVVDNEGIGYCLHKATRFRPTH